MPCTIYKGLISSIKSIICNTYKMTINWGKNPFQVVEKNGFRYWIRKIDDVKSHLNLKNFKK